MESSYDSPETNKQNLLVSETEICEVEFMESNLIGSMPIKVIRRENNCQTDGWSDGRTE